MRVRFFNALDPHSPPDPGREVLLIGLSSENYPPPQGGGGEVHEAVRLATAEDVQTWGAAYQAYVTAQEAAQKAEKEAGHTAEDPQTEVLTPPGMPPSEPPPPEAAPPGGAQHGAQQQASHEAQRQQPQHPQAGGSGRR